MAEDQVLTSAIVVPDDLKESLDPVDSLRTSGSASPERSLKRRQSSISEYDVKRPRLSTDGTGSSARESPLDDGRRAVRRQNGQLEERKRGQRLFGALLGTLSQSSSAAHNRRADIEKRQRAKLKQQADEVSQRQQDRLEELTATRRREQKKLDQQSMRIRHSNMLNQANFLQTTAEPRLYYKPWDLLPEQDEQIRQQIEEARTTIDQELEDFDRRRAEEDTALESSTVTKTDVDKNMEEDVKPVGAEPLQQAAESHIQENGDTNIAAPSTTNGHAGKAVEEESVPIGGESVRVDDRVPSVEAVQSDLAKEVAAEDHGETVVEAAEDTIIY